MVAQAAKRIASILIPLYPLKGDYGLKYPVTQTHAVACFFPTVLASQKRPKIPNPTTYIISV